MPIKVSCHCGQSFQAKDELMGQTLLCPKCHEPLTIGEGTGKKRQGSGGGMADLFDEAGIERAWKAVAKKNIKAADSSTRSSLLAKSWAWAAATE